LILRTDLQLELVKSQDYWFGEVSKVFSRVNWSFGRGHNTKNCTTKIHIITEKDSRSRRIKYNTIYLRTLSGAVF